MTLTFGEIMLRLCPENGNLLMQSLPGKLNATFGGAEANVAVSLSNLGIKSRYVTALPDNQISEACLRELRGIGVDVSFIKLVKNTRLGVYFVEAGANQRPSKVIYDRENSSISLTSFHKYDFENALEGIKRVHISGITPALSSIAADASIKLASLAKSKGILVSCDLNFRNKLWNWENGFSSKELARKIMPLILENTDLLIGNEEDAFDVLGLTPKDSDVHSGKINLEGYKEIAMEISNRFKGIRKIAFTLRESLSATHNNWGAMLFDAESKSCQLAPMFDGEYKPYEIRNIIDRVGGGDSFAAGLLFGLDSGEFVCDKDALAFAVASSCLAHSVLGDYNFVPKSDVIALMKGSGSGRVQR